MACHRSLGASSGDLYGDGLPPVSGFGVLGSLDEFMDLGFAKEAGPRDLQMVDYGATLLKRGHSPPSSPSPNSCGISRSKMVTPFVDFITTGLTTAQVSLMNLVWLGNGRQRIKGSY